MSVNESSSFQKRMQFFFRLFNLDGDGQVSKEKLIEWARKLSPNSQKTLESKVNDLWSIFCQNSSENSVDCEQFLDRMNTYVNRVQKPIRDTSFVMPQIDKAAESLFMIIVDIEEFTKIKQNEVFRPRPEEMKNMDTKSLAKLEKEITRKRREYNKERCMSKEQYIKFLKSLKNHPDIRDKKQLCDEIFKALDQGCPIAKYDPNDQKHKEFFGEPIESCKTNQNILLQQFKIAFIEFFDFDAKFMINTKHLELKKLFGDYEKYKI